MSEWMKKTRAAWPRIMLVMLTALLVWQIPKMTDLAPLTKLTMPMAALWAAAGLLGIVLLRLWREPRTLLLLLGLCWMGGTSLLRGTLWSDLTAYIPCACAFLFCFHAPRAGSLGELKKQVTAVCFVWVLWMTALSAAALYASFAGVHLRQTSWERFIGINGGDFRLYIMDYCTNAAGNLLTAVLAVLGVAACTEKRAIRAAAIVCLAVLLTALSLTDARTSFIGVGAGMGAAAACAVFHAMPGKRKHWRYTASLACAGAVLVLAYLGVSALTNLAGSFVPGSSASVVPTAAADEAAVTHRTLGSGAGLLTYRDDVWRGVLSFLKAEPMHLLTGAGPASLMAKVSPYVVSAQQAFSHPHCIWLHLLGAYGIPGLLLALTFTGLFVRDAWLVLFTGERPRWVRLLPIPAIAVLVCELAECLTLGSVNGPILILLFFSMGAASAARRLTDKAE